VSRPRARPAPRAGARRGAPALGRARQAAPAPRLRRPWRASFAQLRAHRRLRIALLCLLVALPALGGGWLWFRTSSFVAVEHVQLDGVRGPEARAIESALTGAARRMTTLDVRTGALLAAVAPLRVVRAVRASASFPHGLRLAVVEQPPVAALTVGSARTAVAADGVVLGPALLTGSLPTLGASAQAAPGTRLRNPGTLGALSVLGAAPVSLARFIAHVYEGPQGLTVAMRNGLLVYFGDASRPHAKWLSLARVLADPSSAGASYVDVRLPERPAAGFPAGVTPPAQSAAGAASAGGEAPGGELAPANEESAVAALAAGLSAGSGVGASASAGAEAPGGATTTTTTTGEAASGSPAAAQAPGSGSEQPAGAPASEAAAGAAGAVSPEAGEH